MINQVGKEKIVLLVILAAVVGFAALTAILLWRRREANPPNPRAQDDQRPSASAVVKQQDMALVWERGVRQMYRVAIQSRVEMMAAESGTSPTKGVDLEIEGTLNCRHLGEVEGVNYVAFQWSPVEVRFGGRRSQTLEGLYSNVFVVMFCPFGSVLETIHPVFIRPREKDSIKGLMSLLQVTIPSRTNRQEESNWCVEEKDAIGTYLAEYNVAAPGVLVKQKREYRRTEEEKEAARKSGAGDVDVQIEASSFQAVIKPGVSWLDELTGGEVVRMTMPARVRSEVRSSVSLKRIDYRPNASLSIWNLTGDYKTICEKLVMMGYNDKLSPDAWEKVRLEQLRERYAGVSIFEMYNNLIDAIAGMEKHADTVPALYALRDYLQAYPKYASEIPGIIKEKKLDDQQAGRLIHALELAGTPECQEQLVRIANDQDQQANQRLQSVVAMGGVDHPEAFMTKALLDLSERQDVDDRLRNTSILSYGMHGNALGASKTDEDRKAAQRIVEKLYARLQAADDEEKEILLLALDNTHRIDVEKIQPYLESQSGRIRSAALRGLRHAPPSTAIPILEKAMTQDVSSDVRETAFETLLQFGDAGTASLVRERAPKEGSGVLKRKMIGFLGERRSDPANAACLKSLLTVEQDSALQKAIKDALGEESASP
jgi:hypothetical protein